MDVLIEEPVDVGEAVGAEGRAASRAGRGHVGRGKDAQQDRVILAASPGQQEVIQYSITIGHTVPRAHCTSWPQYTGQIVLYLGHTVQVGQSTLQYWCRTVQYSRDKIQIYGNLMPR